MYTRNEYLTSGNGQKAYAAQCLDSIEWNKKVGGDIANELHKKLLPYYSEFVMPYLNILPLLESGYLGTVKEIASTLKPEIESLKDIQLWLIDAVTEADELSKEEK